MDITLEDIDLEWKTGDRDLARAMAHEFVEAHPEMEAEFGDLAIPELVSLVSIARKRGDEEARRRVDTWLLAKHQPQRIAGNFRQPAPNLGVA